MSDVIKGHLDGIEVALSLLMAQVKALRHALQPVPSAKLAVSVPHRCKGVDPALCGLQNDDARQHRASFAHPHAWRCDGCGHQSFEATG